MLYLIMVLKTKVNSKSSSVMKSANSRTKAMTAKVIFQVNLRVGQTTWRSSANESRK